MRKIAGQDGQIKQAAFERASPFATQELSKISRAQAFFVMRPTRFVENNAGGSECNICFQAQNRSVHVHETCKSRTTRSKGKKVGITLKPGIKRPETRLQEAQVVNHR